MNVQVAVWDLRGGQGAPSFGARGPSHHSQIDCHMLVGMLGNLSDVVAETGPVRTSVDSIALDRQENQRLAFTLGNGWSG